MDNIQRAELQEHMNKLMLTIITDYLSLCQRNGQYFVIDVIWDNDNLEYGFRVAPSGDVVNMLDTIISNTLEFSCERHANPMLGWVILLKAKMGD